MTKLNRSYVSHLTINESAVWPGGEWTPTPPGWAVIQVVEGSGCWMGPQGNQELGTGAVLLMSSNVSGHVRAEGSAALLLRFFFVALERLTGLITLSEQRFFEAISAKQPFALRIFATQSSIADRMNQLSLGRNPGGLRFRLQLIQLFVEAFANETSKEIPALLAPPDAKARLEE